MRPVESDAGVLHDSHDRSEGVRGRENTVKKTLIKFVQRAAEKEGRASEQMFAQRIFQVSWR